jgi:4-alpha-glucanotransferase
MTNFVFCIHNHQPVGNFDTVLEEAYKDSYWPFLEAVSKHPSIKLTIHNTGFLLDWLIKNRPEYIELLRSMAASGQAEIMGGGYYEPILQVLPERDRISQIRMMSERVEKVFGVRPRGIWLAERIWEPALPTTLKKAGIEYLLVDDYHFIKSGLKKEELGGYYVTEDQGNVLKIFPGSESLRYLIPFQETDKLEAHLKGLKGYLKRGNCAIYGDDGEKFGVWPGTGKWVFEEGWLERFFSKIEDSAGWLKPVTMSEVMDSEEPLGRIYLPTTSYMEMGEWSLPAEASKEYTGLIDRIGSWHDGETVRRFLQGGTWRNFFSKYPESNWLHKRMLMVSRALETRPDSAASDHLYRAQCNDAYWHGVFGGLYLPHLRTAAYKNLIDAENVLGGAEFRPGSTVTLRADLDADGFDEVLLRTRDLNLFISPRNGGSVFEIDFKPVPVNLSNTLSRWFEGYHHKLEYTGADAHHGEAKSIHDMVKVKEAGLEKYLKYDSSRRVSFVERFLSGGETLESFYSNAYKDLGDFSAGAYDCEMKDNGVTLERKGRLGGGVAVITKEITAAANSFSVDYRLKDLHKGVIAADITGRFCVELNILMPCCDGPACQYRFTPEFKDEAIGLGSTGELKGVKSVAIADTYTGVIMTIEADRPVTLWRFPVYTVSLSEGGFEKIYQGSCLAFMFPLSFDDDSEMKAGLKVRVESI